MIEPVRATRTFEAAIEHLTEAIERAGLRHGDRLPSEAELAEQLGISKPTLRQALRVLELSGLVDGAARQGGRHLRRHRPRARGRDLRARSRSRRRRRSTCCARAACSSAPSRSRRCATATAADLAELERTIDLLERHLGERPSVMRADAMFHRALVRAATTPRSRRRCAASAAGLAPIRDAYSGGVAYDRETLDVHRRQLDAMRRRDADALERVLDEHFRMLETPFAEAIGRAGRPVRRRAPGARADPAQPATSTVTARAPPRRPRSRRRRGPPRRPAAASARRTGSPAGRRRGARRARRGRAPRASVDQRNAGGPGHDSAPARRGRARGRTTRLARHADASRPRYVYGAQFATSANAARPTPSTSSAARTARAATRRARAPHATNAMSPGRRPSLAPAEPVDPPDELGVEPDARVEREPPPVHPAEPDRPVPPARRGRAATTGRAAARARAAARSCRRPGRTRAGRGRTPFSTSLYVPSPANT